MNPLPTVIPTSLSSSPHYLIAVTNFPFVPTIKVISTSNRYKLVHSIMDFNAGRMQDGEGMDALTDEIFDLCLKIASGTKSIGEVAGNSQVCTGAIYRINQ